MTRLLLVALLGLDVSFAAPAISALNPASATAGTPGGTLTVSGSGFGNGASLFWNGTDLHASEPIPNLLIANIGASLLASPGTVGVTVRAGNGQTSPAATFTILPPPAIDSLSPAQAAAGGPQFTLTVNGSNFAGRDTVAWNGAPLTTSGTEAQLAAVVPAPLIASPGTATVTVQTADGVSSAGVPFTVTAAAPVAAPAPAPAIAITTAALPNGTAGAPYAQTLAASGGAPPYTWSVAAGTLPPGLILSGATIGGTPGAAGTFGFTVRATDAAGASATKDLTLTIGAGVAIGTSSLPPGTVGAPYSQSLTATGGAPPYSWSVASGALPAGIALNGGTLAGTPTAAGTASFTVQVTDASGAKAAAPLSIAVAPAPTPVAITTSALPNGTAGVPYSQTLAASGGTAPYTWSVAAGNLPPGLALSGATLGGTPTAAGNFGFTLRAADAAGGSATKDFTIAIAAGLAIGTSSLPSATVGAPYSQSLTATGGAPPYTWSVASGALPAGIALNGGTLAGTPTAAGTSSFTVQATDGSGAKAAAPLSIAVAPAPTPVAITTSALPNGTAGVPYSQTLSASGGTAPYTWSVAAGTLPPGLSLSGATLGGTPSAAGAFGFTLRAADAAGGSATKDFTITVAAGLAIGTSSLPSGTVGKAYSQSLTATGGAPPYTWSVASGTLPSGIALNGSTLAGTPAAAGTANFTVQAADASGAKATSALTITVVAPVSISTAALPNGTAGVPYSQTLSATGGTPPYAWAVAGGSLPPGLALNGAQIQGTPGAQGNFTVTLRATDASGAAASHDFALSIGAGLAVTTTSLPNATAGVPYSQTVSASGGAAPYTWSVASGSLPAGIALNSATGALAGTPSAPGPAMFNIQATDAAGAKASQSLTINVAPGLSITTASLPAGATSAPYSQALSAAGGTPPYVWSVADGQLPPGMTLTASGALGGTPTQNGDFPFTAKVTDSTGATATRALAVHIGGGLTIATASLQPATTGAPYAQALSAAGGVPPYRWAVAAGSALPAGLALDAATGVISGTPTTPGNSSITVQVTDASGATASSTLTLTVSSDLIIQTASLPNGTAGVAYAQPLTAAGGKPPYKWSLANGGPLPPGLSLDPAGAIRGTPTQAGPVTFTAVVTDSAGAQATKQLTLTISGGLTVSTTSLPAGAVSTAYSQPLAAAGGVPPYTWSVSAGALPAGLTLDPATGTLSGTPAAAGTFPFTAQVKDAAQVTAAQPLSLTIGIAALPGVTIGGAPDTGAPLAQTPVQVALASAFPADITGQVTLAFQSSAAVPADDKAITFVNGGRSVLFRIPAGQTLAVFPDGATQAQFQNGTVQGTVTISATLQSAGAQLGSAPPKQMAIAAAPPVIRSVKLVSAASGFEVWVTGFSTTRELIDATFAFDGAAGSSLQTSQVVVPVGQQATAWYQDANSAQWGSQFTLVQPFTVQGSANAVAAATVTLRNAQGASQPVKSQ